jgi:GT2 family glycosyltransferase
MGSEKCKIIDGLISIIIVNYNTTEYLRKCLYSIYKFENPEMFEVIVVDNASEENIFGTFSAFTDKYNNIRCIISDSNLGFSKAVNKGFKEAKGEYILIMNPDIEIRKDLFSRLKSHFDNKRIGAVSPLLKGEENNIQFNYYQKYPALRQFLYFHSIFAKIFINNVKLRTKFLYESSFVSDKYSLAEVSQLPCAFLLTRRDIFSDAGRMNEKYFLFFEDMDLCFRIRRNYKLYVDTAESVLHIGGSSFNIDKNPDIYGKYILSMNIFFDLNYTFLRALVLKIITVFNSLLILSIEYLKKLIKKSDEFRIRKHKYFLQLFKKQYL